MEGVATGEVPTQVVTKDEKNAEEVEDAVEEDATEEEEVEMVRQCCEKARAAEHAGAKMLVIVNSNETKPDAVLEMPSRYVDQNTSNIPVVMISYNGGLRARKLGAGAPVSMARMLARRSRISLRDTIISSAP